MAFDVHLVIESAHDDLEGVRQSLWNQVAALLERTCAPDGRPVSFTLEGTRL